MTTHRVRRAVQLIFLLFFLWLFLQTESKGADQLGYPVKLFLDGDPLIFITTVLATRSFYGGINVVVLVAAVVVATVLLGRVFCGWVCPMGTLHELVGNSTKGNTKRSQGRDEERGDQPLYRLKYLLLVFIMVSAALGMQTAAFFDPISLLIRSLALAVYPAFAYGLTALVELLYYPELSPLTAVADMLLRGLKASILPFQQPFFHQALPIGLLFFLILSLNMVRKRFWCRFICPLGALLGLLGRYALLNRMVAEGCDGCRRCEKYCQGGAGPASRGEWKKAECLVCLECLDPCPRAAARFKMGGKAGVVTGLDLGRRRVIGAALAGAVLVPLVRVSPAAQATVANPVLIRPPGAVGEKEFLARCIRCGECMKVCITGGLQPALVEAGLEGLWSPVLVPRVGYCEYRCT
ncbi:MAG: 4Fe-4S binding protein, partial [Syntrophales bacterium]|nr:4Fe-4S binding protein [Syntrophales bacterium]